MLGWLKALFKSAPDTRRRCPECGGVEVKTEFVTIVDSCRSYCAKGHSW
ncbi:hypothetical protein EV664_101108 [Stakelama pacifica]|uniref:Uncharacterized protein n=1 Tax=Stakelama pacifica TaxID=517720 RepID=A0A4R6FXM5_9SPHN|nr:hypothetical protein EV664_101108 [Stakelama pacifica]